MYFNINYTENKIIFIFNNIAHDILWDYSKIIIPFSNKKTYYNYQALVFILLDFFQYTSIYLITTDNIIQIIINNIQKEQYQYIIYNASKIINDFINSKFTIFN